MRSSTVQSLDGTVPKSTRRGNVKVAAKMPQPFDTGRARDKDNDPIFGSGIFAATEDIGETEVEVRLAASCAETYTQGLGHR